MKVLLLHGGSGATHEYLEAFDSYFPAAGIEYYDYDQLGSYYDDQLTYFLGLIQFIKNVDSGNF